MKILFLRKIQWLYHQIWVPWRYPRYLLVPSRLCGQQTHREPPKIMVTREFAVWSKSYQRVCGFGKPQTLMVTGYHESLRSRNADFLQKRDHILRGKYQILVTANSHGNHLNHVWTVVPWQLQMKKPWNEVVCTLRISDILQKTFDFASKYKK